MALDDSLYCTMRDVIGDANMLAETRDRMLKALDAYRSLEKMAEELTRDGISVNHMHVYWLTISLDTLKKV